MCGMRYIKFTRPGLTCTFCVLTTEWPYINSNTRMVQIKWNDKKVMEGDPKVTRQKLLIRSWNPKNPSSGAWRQFIGNPDA